MCQVCCCRINIMMFCILKQQRCLQNYCTKKKNLFTVVQCLVSSTAGKLRKSHTKRKDKKSSFSLYQCSSTMLFSPVFQHSLLPNVPYCVSSHQILKNVQFSYPFCMFLLFDPFLLFGYLDGGCLITLAASYTNNFFLYLHLIGCLWTFLFSL